jgi:hypothetical protein
MLPRIHQVRWLYAVFVLCASLILTASPPDVSAGAELVIAQAPDPSSPVWKSDRQPSVVKALECGGAGQQCCDHYRALGGGIVGPRHCNPGLGCNPTTLRCESGCGAEGSVCCDGPDTVAAHPVGLTRDERGRLSVANPMCRGATVCNRATNRCVGGCGGSGQDCCPPTPHIDVASCLAILAPQHTCAYDDEAETSGVCVPCGREGQPPCLIEGCAGRLRDFSGVCLPCGLCGERPCPGRACLQLSPKMVIKLEKCQAGDGWRCTANGDVEWIPPPPPLGTPVKKDPPPPDRPPQSRQCECVPHSKDPACGAEIRQPCDAQRGVWCRAGLGCTPDPVDRVRRCRQPHDQAERELWNCPTLPNDQCWTKKDVETFACHFRFDDDDDDDDAPDGAR